MKCTIITLLSFLLLLSNNLSLDAQRNFIKGYIITSQSDTIHGLIDFRDWDKNPTSIKFKKDKAGVAKKYNSAALESFHIEPNYSYKSRMVNMDITPNKLENLYHIDTRKKRIVEDTLVFLKTYIQGNGLQLYYFKDHKAKEHFYIQKNKEDIEELGFQKYRLTETGINSPTDVLTIESYKSQLLDTYMLDCEQVRKKIRQTDYVGNELRQLISAYNECANNKQIDLVEKEQNILLKIGFIAGVTKSQLSFRGSGALRDYLHDYNFPSSTDFIGGIAFEFILPQQRRSLSLYNEVLYKRFSTQGSYETFDNLLLLTVKNETAFEVSSININNFFRYTYPSKNIQPFLQFGLNNNLSLRSQSPLITTATFSNGEERIEMGDVTNNFRQYELGLSVGTGIKIKLFSLELRYNMSTAPFEILATASKVNTLHLLGGIHF